MGFKFGSQSKRFASGIDSQLWECAQRALSKSTKGDYKVAWRGGLRTADEQNAIFNEGNSLLDGYDKKSYHQTGLAIDIIPVGDEPYSNTRALNYFGRLMMIEWQLMIMSCEAEGYIVWGGTFGASSWDRPHFEIHK
jgi:peptidoglycan L-alanyl-D-glutamate endopeptidase CwlK